LPPMGILGPVDTSGMTKGAEALASGHCFLFGYNQGAAKA
jgi:hypothetical protein